MSQLRKETFVCVDVEATGLDPTQDHIIEIAAVKFTFDEIIDSMEHLVNPGVAIPQESIAIHHITNEMVANKPPIQELLPLYLDFIGTHIIVGHSIFFDISMMKATAQRLGIPHRLEHIRYIDTLRLARLYGESPTNSLDRLRQHFNIEDQGRHRAMSDVMVNIDVFKHLTSTFKTTEQIFDRLSRPILLKTMPLGKHKGRPFNEIPIEYLYWASKQDFDQDLAHSLRVEITNRKKGKNFSQASSPFQNL